MGSDTGKGSDTVAGSGSARGSGSATGAPASATGSSGGLISSWAGRASKGVAGSGEAPMGSTFGTGGHAARGA
jgi:hypothetical protein